MNNKPILMRYFLILATLTSSWTCEYNLPNAAKISAEQKIITVLYDSLAKNIPPPSPNLRGMNEKDSLRISKRFNSIRDSLSSRKQMVAVNSKLHPLESELEVTDFNSGNKEFIKHLNSLKEKKPLDLAGIRTLRNDSIVEFEEKYLREFSADYFEIDKLILFSRIAFNKAGTEAAVVATVGISRLASLTTIYFFRKVEEKWILVDSKGLSMS